MGIVLDLWSEEETNVELAQRIISRIVGRSIPAKTVENELKKAGKKRGRQ